VVLCLKAIYIRKLKKQDGKVTLKITQDWYKKNVEKTKYSGGTNSFVAPEAKYEYQIDLFFYKRLEESKN
jgi:hypothetical protein